MDFRFPVSLSNLAATGLLTALLAGAIACSAPAPSQGDTSQEPRAGGTLNVGNAFQPFGLDHHLWVGGIGTTGPISPVHTQLLQYDPLDESKIINDLAERWESGADATSYTFFIRKGVKFHNGTPLTSKDVKATYERLMTPQEGIAINAGLRAGVQQIGSIETPDDYTVKFVMKRTQPSFPALQAHTGYSIYPKALLDAKADFEKEVMGAGPFKFVNYTPGTSVTLEKFPDYFVPGRPYLDKIVNFIMNDDNTRLAALRTGQITFVYTFPGLLPSQVQLVKRAVPDIVIQNPVAINTERFILNYKHKPLDDVRVRKAIHLALDREVLNEVARQGIVAPGGAMIPSGKWGLSSEEVAKLPGFRQPKDQDLAEAKRLLAEAGYGGGFKLVNLVRQGRLDEDMAQVLKVELAKIGVELELKVVEQSARTVLVNKGDWDSYNVTDSGEADDPDAQLGSRYYSKVVSQWTATNPEFDRLYEEQTITVDQEKRREIVRRLQFLVFDYVPAVIVGWPTWAGAHWSKVRDFRAFTIIYNNLKMQDVWLAE